MGRTGAGAAGGLNGLSLCAGVGGLELGIRSVFPAYRTVCYVEREIFAAEVLAARMEDGDLEDAPIWDDLTTFDGKPWRGTVDLVSAGLPCQPYSVAGKRMGDDDERALWPEFVRIVGECKPAIIILENVPAFLEHLEPVYTRLQGMGFDFAPPAQWTARECGAPHIRKRIFVLAAHPSRIRVRLESGWSSGQSGAGASGARPAYSHDPDPIGKGLPTIKPQPAYEIDGVVGQEHPNPNRTGLEGRGLRGPGRADELPAGPMGDTGSDTHRRRRLRLGSGWVFDRKRETLRHDPDGLCDGCRTCGSPWAAESPVLRVDDGMADEVGLHRAAQLRAIGNGVVPQQAEAAIRWMLQRFPGGEAEDGGERGCGANGQADCEGDQGRT